MAVRGDALSLVCAESDAARHRITGKGKRGNELCITKVRSIKNLVKTSRVL